MRILFVTKFFVHDNFGRDPLGILYLSSALKKAGHQTDIADAANRSEAKRVFSSFQPDIVAFSITTSTYKDYVDICREFKKIKPGIYVIFGGPHCTFHPSFFEDIKEIDAICRGEGEEAIVDFAARFSSGGEYWNTPNFIVKREGRIIRNDVRPLISDIDSIVFPDRDLLKRYRFVSGFPVKTFISTRGCPFDCTYCYNYAYAELYKGKGKRVRTRSVDNLLLEIKQESTRSQIDFINFEDDIFGMNTAWLEEFSKKYPAVSGVPFCCNVRVEYVNEKTMDLLKRSGCHTCVMGIESGDPEIREGLLNRHMSDDRIVEACKIIHSRGILLEAENILGLPGVTYAQEKKTLELNIRCRPDYPASYLFQPQPKTILGQKAIEVNMFNGDYSNMGNYYKSSVLALKDGKRRERLRSLFFFIVRWPSLNRFTDILVSLPLGGLYYSVHAVARGYMARFQIMPYRFKLMDFIYQLYRYLICN